MFFLFNQNQQECKDGSQPGMPLAIILNKFNGTQNGRHINFVYSDKKSQ